MLAAVKRPVVLGDDALRFGESLLGSAVLTVRVPSQPDGLRDALVVVVEGGLVLIGGGLLADSSLHQLSQLVGR